MQAIVVHAGDEVPRLIWTEVADVVYGSDEVLVDVRASAVNRADLAQARGSYAPPPGASEILGLEMAGEIAAVGANVSGWQPGDRVCALLTGGGYAAQAAVPQELLLRLPEEWSFSQGAAVPEVWYTAFVNLFIEGGLQEGETVLIHAGASGVGTAAIQLAREVGARIIITAGTAEKLEACRELGADLAINYKEQDFEDEIRASTAGEGVDLILDPVGGSYLTRNLALLKRQGRMVNIGSLGGNKGELDIGLLRGRRLRLIGSVLRSRSLAEKVEITRRFKQQFWPLFLDGTLTPIIDTTFPMADAQKAHEYVRQNKNTGKVVLMVNG